MTSAEDILKKNGFQKASFHPIEWENLIAAMEEYRSLGSAERREIADLKQELFLVKQYNANLECSDKGWRHACKHLEEENSRLKENLYLANKTINNKR